jgi:hypothetical protein
MDGQPVASASIIESIDPKMEINLHLRAPDTAGSYRASVVLFYLQELGDEAQGEDVQVQSERMVVDQAETTLVIE